MDNQSKAIPGQYLTFLLRKQLYGVDIGTVREINRVSEITSVPKTPKYVAGVMNLRGKVIPVVDIRSKFGMELIGHTKETCIIVIEADHGQIGIIVDAVSGVIDLKTENIEPRPTMGKNADLEYVMGLGKIDNQVVILVNIVSALSKEALSGIQEVVEKSAA